VDTPAACFVAQFADLLENREPAAVRERRLRRDGDDFDHAPPALRVLIALREDALPALTPLRAQIPELARTAYRLRPLSRAAAMEVILRPAADSPSHANLLGEIPAALAEDIITRMEGEGADNASVDPFLLSVVMDQLHRRAAGAVPPVITHALVKDGVAAALDTFYENAVAQVPEAFRDWLETDAGLVTAGGFRNSIAADDAAASFARRHGGTSHSDNSFRVLDPFQEPVHGIQTSPDVLDHLRTLENVHLLRSEPRTDGSLRFELVHDRLCAVLAGKMRLRAEVRANLEKARILAGVARQRVALRRAWLVAAGCVVLLLLAGWALRRARDAEATKGDKVKELEAKTRELGIEREQKVEALRKLTIKQAEEQKAKEEALKEAKRATIAEKAAEAAKDAAIREKEQAGILASKTIDKLNGLRRRPYNYTEAEFDATVLEPSVVNVKSAQMLGQDREALEYRKELAEQNPNNMELWMALASDYEYVGIQESSSRNWPEALAAFDREIEIARLWLQLPEHEIRWMKHFSFAAAKRWQILNVAPPRRVMLDRNSALSDLRQAEVALKSLRNRSRLAPPMDKYLPWIEKLLRDSK
jgi:tetratricopeptide (TPR) repeat protein